MQAKTFMPKYKVDFRIVRILGNKVEVKDNHGKLSFYHVSDIKKTDMITKLICQLPDHDAFGRRGRLSFELQQESKTLDGTSKIKSISLTLPML